MPQPTRKIRRDVGQLSLVRWERGLCRWGQRKHKSIAGDLFCAKTFDDRTIEPALIAGSVGGAAVSCTVRFIGREAARKKIGRDDEYDMSLP